MDTEDAKMTAEIDVRKQRMQGAYARYEKDIFNSDLSERCKASLFNVVVVANGLFGCQVWNVTQLHVDDLEATYSRLLRKMLKKTKIEMSRGELLRYTESKNLNISPIEWRMTKFCVFVDRFFQKLNGFIHKIINSVDRSTDLSTEKIVLYDFVY
jgi:hypothetical protein